MTTLKTVDAPHAADATQTHRAHARPTLGASLRPRVHGETVAGEETSTRRLRMSTFGRRRKDDGPVEPSLSATWTTGTMLTTKAVSWALAGALITGPVAIVLHFADQPQASTAAASAGLDNRLMSRRSVASEVAAQWVTAWLTTPHSKADSLRAHFTGIVQLPKVPSAVANVRVVDALPAAPGVWTVTVAADVTAPKQAAVRRYYQVPVAVSGDAGQVVARANAVPAQVSAPGESTTITGVYSNTVDPAAPLGQAVAAYLSAALAGQGDVSRYVTPGSPLKVIATGAGTYKAVTVQSIRASERVPGAVDTASPADGAEVHVLVQALAVDRGAVDGDGLSVTYPLALRARGGRWEIQAIDPALYDPEPVAPTAAGAATQNPAGATAPLQNPTGATPAR